MTIDEAIAMKYVKKPVVIDAIQWTGDNIDKIKAFAGEYVSEEIYGCLHIFTLEGVMTATKDDYIIRGVHGEYYPCKPDIFTETYQLAE